MLAPNITHPMPYSPGGEAAACSRCVLEHRELHAHSIPAAALRDTSAFPFSADLGTRRQIALAVLGSFRSQHFGSPSIPLGSTRLGMG